MKIAICTTSDNAYSETFIQAHKNIPGIQAYFYYGGLLPAYLEGIGSIVKNGLQDRARYILKSKLKRNIPSYHEGALARSFREQKIQLVLAEYGPVGATVLPVCKRLSLPLITHFHGYDASLNEVLQQYADSYRQMFEYASYIVVVSRAMERRLLELGCPAEKLVLNTCGPNEAFYACTPAGNSKHFIGIGRFVDKKAPYYTLLAFHQLLQQHPDARLVLGGDGILLNTCKNLVRYLGMGSQVELPGVLSPEQFRRYLTESVAFVQHSITAANGDSEGTPVAVLEASAAGLPVISTRHAGIPDVILHRETGLLVDEHDVNGMADNMKWVLEHPAEAREMGEKGRARIQADFSINRHLGKLSEIVQAAVENVGSNKR